MSKTSPKQRWHAQKRAFLHKVALALNLATDQRDVRSSFGGPAVGGEVILHTDRIYVHLKCPVSDYGSDPTAHLYDDAGFIRTVTSRKDYQGGPNHPIPRGAAQSIPQMVCLIAKLAHPAQR